MVTKKVEAKDPTGSAIDELDKFLARAQKGDKTTLPALREMMDKTPSLFRKTGDLAFQAQASLIRAMAGNNLVVQEVMPRRLAAMKAELAGPSPTAVESLLVERIVTCWLSLHYAEVLYNQNMGELSIRQAEYHQRRLNCCHSRYLFAIRTLALVRRLLRPTVAQVNIAEQQVNIVEADKGNPMQQCK